MASTIEAGEGEYRRFTETMTLTEQMVHNLFGEAVRQQQFLSARSRDALEGKFVTLLKAKVLSTRISTLLLAWDLAGRGNRGDRR